MSNEGFELDARDVLDTFANLTGKQQSKVYKDALKKAARILVTESKRQLRNVVGKKVNNKNR